MWTKSDEDLVEQAKRELAAARPRRREQGRGRLRRADAEGVPGLRRALQGQRRRHARAGSPRTARTSMPSGRNGMHRYNNQDHSMYTAMLSVENIFGAAPRRLVGERRGRVPRGTRRRRGRRRHATASAAPGATRRCCRARRSTPPRPQRRERGRLMRVQVCTPTYIEAENIEELLHRARAALPDADILVLDDNSPDGTADIAERVGAELGHDRGAAPPGEARARQRVPRRLRGRDRARATRSSARSTPTSRTTPRCCPS